MGKMEQSKANEDFVHVADGGPEGPGGQGGKREKFLRGIRFKHLNPPSLCHYSKAAYCP